MLTNLNSTNYCNAFCGCGTNHQPVLGIDWSTKQQAWCLFVFLAGWF